ncbi:hypothetical protein HPB52_019990 [Rhipicephalus sanguineus]|uniref:Reverse transcriptase domain-containing protein n=1 Tax=Rhipicephalus sanguineus TaxID=34632 RepID=A0A9D4TBH4_RHISA|nr:hypothetical protein HPB52_019990 [Rhipicephalus sanguineus]
MISNLIDKAIEALTNHFNDNYWIEGKIPDEWKAAKIITIPKPGKKPSLQALRPVSLTSCMGKLFERVIHTRLQNIIEDNGLFPATMLGFRSGLSTQDAFLLLQEEVLSSIPKGGEHLILALDLKGAFDKISHKAILSELNNIGCGENTFNYIKAFLTARRATISVAQVASEPFEMPNRSTLKEPSSLPCSSISP